MPVYLDTQNRVYENSSPDSVNDQQLPFVSSTLTAIATASPVSAVTVFGQAWATQASVNNQ